MSGRLAGKVAFITAAAWAWGARRPCSLPSRARASWWPTSTRPLRRRRRALVGKAGGEALATVGDVALEADVQRMVDEGVRRFGAHCTCSTTTPESCGRTATARCSRPTIAGGTG
jgi:hypothetical protein